MALIDCIGNCDGSENCSQCEDCTDCDNCVGCKSCDGCSNCTGCTDCSGCSDVHGATGLENETNFRAGSGRPEPVGLGYKDPEPEQPRSGLKRGYERQLAAEQEKRAEQEPAKK